jgi:hypothetical protein
MLVLTLFETNLGWAPSLDGGASLARMLLAFKKLGWFGIQCGEAVRNALIPLVARTRDRAKSFVFRFESSLAFHPERGELVSAGRLVASDRTW